MPESRFKNPESNLELFIYINMLAPLAYPSRSFLVLLPTGVMLTFALVTMAVLAYFNVKLASRLQGIKRILLILLLLLNIASLFMLGGISAFTEIDNIILLLLY